MAPPTGRGRVTLQRSLRGLNWASGGFKQTLESRGMLANGGKMFTGASQLVSHA